MYIQKTTLCKEAQSIKITKKREGKNNEKKLITKKKRAKTECLVNFVIVELQAEESDPVNFVIVVWFCVQEPL